MILRGGEIAGRLHCTWYSRSLFSLSPFASVPQLQVPRILRGCSCTRNPRNVDTVCPLAFQYPNPTGVASSSCRFFPRAEGHPASLARIERQSAKRGDG
jgi:hypothetical protein